MPIVKQLNAHALWGQRHEDCAVSHNLVQGLSSTSAREISHLNLALSHTAFLLDMLGGWSKCLSSVLLHHSRCARSIQAQITNVGDWSVVCKLCKESLPTDQSKRSIFNRLHGARLSNGFIAIHPSCLPIANHFCFRSS